MPSAVPKQLIVGLNIDIQRSDGRVHSAIVSGINIESHAVTVEWFEHNETKGKELDIEAVLRLNPHLLEPENRESVPKIKRPKSTVEAVTVEAAPASKLPYAKDNRKSYMPARPASSHNLKNDQVSDEFQPPTVVKKENIAPSTEAGQAAPQARDSRKSFMQPRPVSSHNLKNDPVSEDFQAPPTVKKDVGNHAAPAPSDPGPAPKKAVPRKSNVVKEIEKIKEQREQRRAAAQNVVSHVVDKSHPNWQFLDMIEQYRETLDYSPLKSDDVIEDHQICVCVRKRPLNKKELNRRDVDVVTIPNKDNIIIHEPRHKVDLTKYLENQKFRFDYAFDENSDNSMVYRYTAQPLVSCIFEGGMATCFAYGQTGSGKTHTMGGEFVNKGQQDCDKGIYAFSARDVFRLLNSKYKHEDLVVSVSFFEIYSGKVFDLLNNKLKLRILEDGKAQVQVVGLKEETVQNAEQVLKLLSLGSQARTSGQTSANQHSSRSHAIFQLILRKNTRGRPLHGKFSLIDLAGNERGADTSSADRQTRMEGAEINKSLLALKECIRALGKKGAHLPFRASKLTLVLRDSFIGDKARTCMIATISPGNGCCEHTLNTLRYADRVKELGADGATGEPKLFDDSVFENHLTSPQNSDLVLLKTTNQEEVSDDLLNFHEVINHMQELEDEIIEDYKNSTHLMDKWKAEDTKLLKTTDRVDYDVEMFAKHLNQLLDTRIDFLINLRDKVTRFREDLDNEESISRKINKK